MTAVAAARRAAPRAVARERTDAAGATQPAFLWVALVIEVGMALLMIGAPGQFRSVAYDGIRPFLPWYGLAFAATGSLLLLAAIGVTGRAVTSAFLMLASGPLVVLAAGFWRVSILTGAITNLILALMLALVAVETLSGRRAFGGRRHVLVVGAIQVATGPLMVLFPERFPVAAYGQLAHVVGIVGLSYTAVGALLLFAEARGHTRSSAALGLAAAINFTPALQGALEARAWTGLLIYTTHAISMVRTASAPRPTSVAAVCVLMASLVGVSDLLRPSGALGLDGSARSAALSSVAMLLVGVSIVAGASLRRSLRALHTVTLIVGVGLAATISLGLAPGGPQPPTGSALLTVTGASLLLRRRSRYALLSALLLSTLVTVVATLNALAYLVEEPTLAQAYGIFGLRSHAAIAIGALGIAVTSMAAGTIVRGRIGDRVLATTGVFVTGLVMLGGYAAAAGSGIIALLEVRPEAAGTYAVNSISVGLALLLALLLAVVAATVLFTRTLTRPLDDLVDVMLRFAAGDLGARATSAGADQIAAANRAFNQTADRLATTQRELRQLNERLDERVRERTFQLATATEGIEEFAHTVSHDLRAPLRALDGFRALLEAELGDHRSEAAHRHLTRIHDATVRMSALIDDLLALSMASRTELDPERVDLSAMAREVLDAQRRAGAVFRAVVADGMYVRADRALLRTLLESLVTNALKFSRSRSEPVVEIGCEAVDGVATYFVRDNGVGFDMRYVDRLFRPFTRLHTDASFEGTGIGLATVERIVKRHGGRVNATGAPGDGATISFTLPAARP
ncbi:MAG TPA: ATP-binding protein [Candidatus Limnocylindria bacterium]|nr:ATP-binding protein [Candidatus Limnocylindria bacterium]